MILIHRITANLGYSQQTIQGLFCIKKEVKTTTILLDRILNATYAFQSHPTTPQPTELAIVGFFMVDQNFPKDPGT